MLHITHTIRTHINRMLLLLLCGFVSFPSFASEKNRFSKEKKEIDSLLVSYQNLPTVDDRLKLLRKVEKTAQRIKYKRGVMNAYNQIGVCYFMKGELTRSDLYFRKYFEQAVKLSDTMAITMSLNNRASVKLTQGYKEEALKIFQRAIEYLANDQERQYNTVWYNIALIYKDMRDYKRSVGVLRRVLDHSGADSITKIKACNTLGIIYNNTARYDSAFFFIRRGLNLNEEKYSPLDESELLNTLGSIHANKGDIDSALVHFNRALDMAVKYNYKENELIYRINIIEQLMTRKNFAKANQMLVAMRNDFMAIEDLGAKAHYQLMLAESYNAIGRYKEAVDGFVEYKKTADYLDSINDLQQIESFESNVGKRIISIRDSLRSVKQRENDRVTMVQQQETIKRSRERTVYIIIILLVVVVALVIAYRAFRTKSKVAAELRLQKNQIEKQKNIIEEKSREVTDSLNYARKLQQAILPSEKLFSRYFSEHALLYMPKDIVAGDFYFFEEIIVNGSPIVVFAVADCTGHGVPGAMVSVVCSNALHRVVSEFKLTDPGKILDKVRELVLETFEKSGGDVNDGMDIALCAIEFQVSGATLRFAGANNPLWYLQNGELKELSPNKQPIGRFTESKSFTTHTLMLQPGSTLYMFTDGYIDQFGGDKNKKLKASRMREILYKTGSISVAAQGKALEAYFNDWKMDNEQTDDVCVLVVRI